MNDKEKLIDSIKWHISVIENHIEESLEHMTSYVYQLNENGYRSHTDRMTYKDICAIAISIIEDINERNGLSFALKGLEKLEGEKNENSD